MRTTITISESILIDAPQLKVWNFTQDFANRTSWDKTVLACKVLQKKPIKIVRLNIKGGIQTHLKYKLCDKPNRTSLKMYDTQSLFIKGGGGSWKYSTVAGKTQWTQTNALEMSNGLMYVLFGWIVRKELKRNTRIALKRAKVLIEAAP